MTSKSHDPSRLPEFIRKQYEFAAYIRDPDKNRRPDDVEDRRMAVYRELFFNNVEDFISASYPVLSGILGDDRWHAMLKDYFARHRAKTPLFPEMPAEFLTYLQNVRQPQQDDPPFMLELAHYEWMELAVAQDDTEIDWDTIDKEGNLLEGKPVVSPLAWVLSYRFPVHRISTDFQPKEPGEPPTSIIVYRDEKDEVGFIEINPMTSMLLQRLQQTPRPGGKDALTAIADEMQHPDPEIVIHGGLDILENLRKRYIILGTQRS